MDPITRDLVSDPFGGFLPPNLSSPEGEGYVNFSVGLKTVEHMDAISNSASIVFDLNPPIITNAFLNTFDMIAPQSRLTTENTVSTDTTFTINTEGTDDGCGIRSYEIFVSTNHQAYELDRYTGSASFEFTGENGNSYRFYSVAVDSVGNREPISGQPDIEVSIVTDVKDLAEWEGVKVYPNPVSNYLFIEFTLDEGILMNATLYDMQGCVVESLLNQAISAGFHQIKMEITVPDGMYMLKLAGEHKQCFRKMVVNH